MEKEYHKLTIKPIDNDINVIDDPQGDCHRLTSATNTLTVSHREQPSQSTINFILGTYKKGDKGLTPYIGENGNWWIGTEDTGVHAQGDAGADGTDGNGIESIVLHTTVGKIKTYRITFTDTTTFDFSVTDGNDGSDGVDGEDGTDGKSVEIQNSGTYIQWRLVGDTNWINIVALADLKGEDGTDGTNGTNGTDGEDGKSVELQVSATHIQWRLVGNVDWINLIALSELKGDKGDKGDDGYTPIKGVDYFDGTDGTDGRGIVSVIKTDTIGLVDTYTITYTDSTTSFIYVTNGNDGSDGVDGEDGRGIVSIELHDTQEKTKTYRITYTDATYTDIDVIDGNDGQDGLTPYIGMNGNWFIGLTDTGVKAAGTDGTNGEDGNGIVSIIKTGTVDLVDEYTITFTDLSTFLFYVTNGSNGTNGNDGQDGSDGRGITSIIKTSTVGLVDTYTITYSDSTTSTFDVTNGANAEINHDATLTGSGTSGDPLSVVGKTIDNDATEFSGAIDETNDKFTIWDNSLLKWIKFSFTNLKTYLKNYFDTVYQAILVSGTNIKTINNTSLLGSGNIDISGGSGDDVDFNVTRTENTTGSQTIYNPARRNWTLLDITNSASTYTITLSAKPASGGSDTVTNVEHYCTIKNTYNGAKTLVIQKETAAHKLVSEGVTAIPLPISGIYEVSFIYLTRGSNTVLMITKSTLLTETT